MKEILLTEKRDDIPCVIIFLWVNKSLYYRSLQLNIHYNWTMQKMLVTMNH